MLLTTQYLDEADQPRRPDRGDRPGHRDRGGHVGRTARTRSAARFWSSTSSGRTDLTRRSRRDALPGRRHRRADAGPRGRLGSVIPVGSAGPSALARQRAPARRRQHRDRRHRHCIARPSTTCSLSLTGHAADRKRIRMRRPRSVAEEPAGRTDDEASRPSRPPGSTLDPGPIRLRRRHGRVMRRNLLQILRIPTALVFRAGAARSCSCCCSRSCSPGTSRTCRHQATADVPDAGIFVQNAIFESTTTAIGLAEDMKKGLVDRFRSLPDGPLRALLVGRTTSDVAKNLDPACSS